jgi:hypothetical protein
LWWPGARGAHSRRPAAALAAALGIAIAGRAWRGAAPPCAGREMHAIRYAPRGIHIHVSRHIHRLHS